MKPAAAAPRFARALFLLSVFSFAAVSFVHAATRASDSPATSPPPVSIAAERFSDKPLLSPFPGIASAGLFNPAAIRIGSRVVLLFRAQDANGTSTVGYAESRDGGLHFTASPDPVLKPEAPYEKDGGVEDPRLVEINGTFYLTYTGYNKQDAQLCLATSKDLKHWQRRGVILPAYKGTWNVRWTKSGAIVPKKIDGKWWMYYLGTKADGNDYMGLASSPDLLHWKDATPEPVLIRRPDGFDARVMEPGPAPVVTPAGILLLYNGADKNLVYGPGWALFDRNNPAKVIARASEPFLLPTLDWEKVGQVPNVIFLEGAIPAEEPAKAAGSSDGLSYCSKDGFALKAYYGGADRYIGGATLKIVLQCPR